MFYFGLQTALDMISFVNRKNKIVLYDPTASDDYKSEITNFKAIGTLSFSYDGECYHSHNEECLYCPGVYYIDENNDLIRKGMLQFGRQKLASLDKRTIVKIIHDEAQSLTYILFVGGNFEILHEKIYASLSNISTFWIGEDYIGRVELWLLYVDSSIKSFVVDVERKLSKPTNITFDLEATNFFQSAVDIPLILDQDNKLWLAADRWCDVQQDEEEKLPSIDIINTRKIFSVSLSTQYKGDLLMMYGFHHTFDERIIDVNFVFCPPKVMVLLENRDLYHSDLDENSEVRLIKIASDIIQIFEFEYILSLDGHVFTIKYINGRVDLVPTILRDIILLPNHVQLKSRHVKRSLGS